MLLNFLYMNPAMDLHYWNLYEGSGRDYQHLNIFQFWGSKIYLYSRP